MITNLVRDNTMCSEKRIQSLYSILQKISNIPGCIVECGTWRGGLAAMMLQHVIDHDLNKTIFIYDTFEGMPEPGDKDHPEAVRMFHEKKDGEYSDWCRAGLDIVEHTLSQVTANYDDHCFLIEGKVEDTLEVFGPIEVALCRLDTDWYSSTKVEMEVLYPRVVKGGYIIVDDYSDWPGCKQAVDEYLVNVDGEYNLSIEDGSLVIHKL